MARVRFDRQCRKFIDDIWKRTSAIKDTFDDIRKIPHLNPDSQVNQKDNKDARSVTSAMPPLNSNFVSPSSMQKNLMTPSTVNISKKIVHKVGK